MDELIAQSTQMMGQMGSMLGGNMMGAMMSGSGPVISAWASPWCQLGWVLVLGLAVLLITALAWAIRMARRPAFAPETPLAILQRRCARGEITPEQFDTLRRQLA